MEYTKICSIGSKGSARFDLGLRDNIETLRKYINDKTDPTFDFAVNLVKKGTCFVVVKVGEGYEFYPSRFAGYYDNDMDKHLNNTEKDGKETNVRYGFLAIRF